MDPEGFEHSSWLSKSSDQSRWLGITNAWFAYLNNLWGPYTVDCFANYYNCKLQRFFSRFWNPNSSGVDFFIHNLANENCWAVLPVSLITRALHYMWYQRAKATIVVPFWPSANYWPVSMSKFRAFVLERKVVDGQDVLKQGRNVNSLLGSDRFWGQMIASRLDFWWL